MMGHHARASCTSPVRGPGHASAGYAHAGRVAERTKATVLKTVRGESLSRVRIPVLPRCDDQHQVPSGHRYFSACAFPLGGPATAASAHPVWHPSVAERSDTRPLRNTPTAATIFETRTYRKGGPWHGC